MVNQENNYKFKPLKKMKKLLFTAIAVIAFSGVSMAETKEVKNEVEVLKIQLEPNDCCVDNALDVYEFAVSEFYGGCDNINLLNELLAHC